MPVTFGELIVGHKYERPDLAKLWGYKDWHAIGRGVVTPSGQNIVVLLITNEKQESLHQYADTFDGETLAIDGETNHAHDARLAESLNHDQVHLFYREKHHEPFTYHGEVFLATPILNHGPTSSRFVFTRARTEATVAAAIATEQTISGTIDEAFVPDLEGRKTIHQHVVHERSRRNRSRAIELQGTRCVVCGFDFNDFYGAEYARSFILVHHTTSITKVSGPVDPTTDLVPICANCHYMVHRTPGSILSIDELKKLIEQARTAH